MSDERIYDGDGEFHIPPGLEIGPASDVLPMSGEANWGIKEFGVEALRGIDASGITVGVIDTGVDRRHPDLSNCFAARDFTGSRYGAEDRHGHGTHCTGTVGAVNPAIGVGAGCKTVHGKGLGDSGSGSGRGIADAMRWCVDQGATILSMSLGSSSQDRTITNEMERLAAQGVWVVAAAGNSGPGTPDVDWPGRSPFCISVAALNADRSPASFSSAGAKIDTSFSGVQIWSCRPGGGYQRMSGTSMATPGIAGLLALYRAHLAAKALPIPKVDELRSVLFTDAGDLHTPGDDRRTGPGFAAASLLRLNLTPDPKPVE